MTGLCGKRPTVNKGINSLARRGSNLSIKPAQAASRPMIFSAGTPTSRRAAIASEPCRFDNGRHHCRPTAAHAKMQAAAIRANAINKSAAVWMPADPLRVKSGQYAWLHHRRQQPVDSKYTIRTPDDKITATLLQNLPSQTICLVGELHRRISYPQAKSRFSILCFHFGHCAGVQFSAATRIGNFHIACMRRRCHEMQFRPGTEARIYQS